MNSHSRGKPSHSVNRRHSALRIPNTGVHSTTGLVRALSKLGFCSRSEAWKLVRARRVSVNGVVRTNGELRVSLERDRVEVDGHLVRCASRVYLMLNKPRGLVTTAADEQGRETVFECFAGHNLPFLAPVGRLDKASEGLLLFTNDSEWAARLTDPVAGVNKTYHVQIDMVADDRLVSQLLTGLQVGRDFLAVHSTSILRHGAKTSWLEILLDEGKNRHLRRLLAGLGVNVLRLVRVAIGSLALGDLAKGQFRFLTPNEVEALSKAGRSC